MLEVVYTLLLIGVFVLVSTFGGLMVLRLFRGTDGIDGPKGQD